MAAYGYHSDNPVPITEDVPPRGSPEHCYSQQRAACESALEWLHVGGTSVVMATHDLEMVRSTEFRTIELNHGRVVFDSADKPPPETRYTPLIGQPAIGGPLENNWPPAPGGAK